MTHLAKPRANRFDAGAGGNCRLAARFLTLVAIVNCFSLTGCNRTFWRKQADSDTYHVLAEKVTDERWVIPRFDVEPDPRSRFYDPFDPDCEPLPPDDPAAHIYMHLAAGKQGYKSWHKLGDSFSVENPHWLDQFGLTPEILDNASGDSASELPGINEMTVIEAVELANIQSREYQTEIENVYLAALALTFERFRFDVRYLGFGREPSVNVNGDTTPRGDSTVGVNSRFGISQLLPSGGQWAIELANNTLWLFSGGNQSSSASVLSYSLVQPLLFGAGRKIVMENLTQSERTVLYSTRDLARFRKEFFTDTVNSYLDLLFQQQNVVNQRDNISRLERQTTIQRVLASQQLDEISERLPVLPPNLVPAGDPPPAPGILIPPELAGLRYDSDAKALYWRGEMSPEKQALLRGLSDDPAFQTVVNELIQRLNTEVVTLVVAQLETDLASGRNRVRTAERIFQDQLDSYKFQLGLPPNMPVSVDTSVLEPFQLIDAKLPEVEQAADLFVGTWAKLDEEDPQLDNLRTVVAGLKELERQLRDEGLQLVQEDFTRVESLLANPPAGAQSSPDVSNDSSLESQSNLERVNKDVANDRRLFTSLRKELTEVREQIGEMEQLVLADSVPQEQRQQIYRKIGDLRERILKTSQSLQVIQIGLRVELINLEPFTLTADTAVRLGLENRLDLMNARARVMDSRRRVEVQANRLEAVLDLRVDGDLGALGGDAHFDAEQSSFRAGVAITAPLDQVAERNAYRAALIDYQRARRAYMAAEDQVVLQIRRNWRQLSVLRRNFDNSRVAVRLAALQYDSAVEQQAAPGQRSTDATALLRALERVLNAQNSLIADWIAYEQNRLNIHLNMGIMEIDARGVWIDDYYQERAREHESNIENGQPPAPISQLDGRIPAGTTAGRIGVSDGIEDRRAATKSALQAAFGDPVDDLSSGRDGGSGDAGVGVEPAVLE